MATETKSEPDWSTLPTHLLTSIAECLPSRVDVRRYRAVCRDFRSSFTPSPEPRYPYPNVRLPSTIFSNIEPGHLIIKQSCFYAVEQLREDSNTRRRPKTKTWVLRVEELGDTFVFVKKPFCGEEFRNIHKKLPKSLNLLEYRVKEMGRVYDFKFVPDEFSFCYREVGCRKISVSDDGSFVMALDLGKLFIWRNGDEDWFVINYGQSATPWSYFEDIVYYNKKIYAVHSEKNAILSVDPKSLVVIEIGFFQLKLGHCKYLVKSSNDLFLFVKYHQSAHIGNPYNRSPMWFCILKFDEENNDFVPVQNEFKSKVVFLGDDFSFTVSATEFPGLRKNCIYLFDGVFGNIDDFRFDGVDEIHPGKCVGIFDMVKKNARPLTVAGNIFWPPPTWLKPSSRCR